MNAIKTFRDELAISLPHELIPKIKSEKTLFQLAEKLNIKIDPDEPMTLVDFIIQYQAVMRYKYADAMLAARHR